MKDDRNPLDPPDEEELRSAAALARALDGGPSEPDLPQPALEAAALLRLSAGAGKLDEERRAQIRRELLAGVGGAPKAVPERRRLALPRWLLFGLPLAGAAALSLLVYVENPELMRQGSSTMDEALESRPPGAGRAASTAQETAPNDLPAVSALSAADDDPSASAASSARAEAPATDESAASVPAARGLAATEGRADKDASRTWVVAPRQPPSAITGSVGRDSAGSPDGEPAIARRRVPASPSAAAPRGAGSGDGREGEVSAKAAALDRQGELARLGEASRMPQGNAARGALVGLERDVRERRAALLARVDDAALRRAHAELDAASGRAQLERAQRDLIAALDTLGGELDPSDARLARQDLYCRLAETALRLGQPRAALEWTRRGLDLDGPPTPFLAQLMALEGDAWAALGDGASAAASYMKALRVHEALLDESLDGR